MTTPLRTAFRGSRTLTLLAGSMVGLLVFSVLGLVVDDRMLGGQPIWLKPAKFAISFAVYAITLAWLMAHLRRGRKVAGWAAVFAGVTSLVEVGLIVFQAARGRASHFNEATPLDETLFGIMGAMAVGIWLGTVVIAVLLCRDGMADRAGTMALRWGMVLLALGMLQGLLMVLPTEEQLALDERGLGTATGAHAVGVPDGGPGLPLTGWSTTGGDLRIGHFVGIHALQAILLFAMLSSKLVRDAVRRARLVAVFAAGYAGLLVFVTWQALRGQPLLAPDGLTLIVLAGLVVGTVSAAAVAWLRPVRVAD